MSTEHDTPPAATLEPEASPDASGDLSFDRWIRDQVEAEEYFFQKIRLPNGVETPGWSDPEKEKLPHYHLPEDLTGMRVLDVGCAEGFFSFEAEKRGASEVVSIDSFPDSIRRFNICKAAKGSKANGYLANVYELSPRTFG
ncbi:MAG: class I SAM-dependent methyltransferase, partial [Holophagales bacterium]|nr:class I SAM-dependent methyltransferase [Holophagales bacterium]